MYANKSKKNLNTKQKSYSGALQIYLNTTII